MLRIWVTWAYAGLGSSCGHPPCCVWKTPSPGSHPPRLDLTIFLLPVLLDIPEPLGEECDRDFAFRAEHSQVSHLSTLPSGRPLVLTTYCKKKFLCWGLGGPLILCLMLRSFSFRSSSCFPVVGFVSETCRFALLEAKWLQKMPKMGNLPPNSKLRLLRQMVDSKIGD